MCFFGSYRIRHERNTILAKGLEKSGSEVIECHVPMPSVTAAGFIASRRKLIGDSFLRLLPHNIALLAKYATVRDHDVMFLGFLTLHDLPLAKILTKLNRKPLIFDPYISIYDTLVHDRRLISNRSLLGETIRLAESILLDLPDIVVADTHEQAKFYRYSLGTDARKLRTIYVGADEDVFFPRPKPRRNQNFRVLFYGTYIPLHGVHYILEAANILRSYNISFTLIGRGQTYSETRRIASNLKLQNVSFREWIPYDELPKQISKSDVCLGIFGDTMKARRVIPNKVYQCLAMRKPVVTSDTPAAREILVDHRNSLLCDASNPEALARAILELRNDERLREDIASEGYELFKQRFTSVNVGASLVEILEPIL